jgi:hypothetical protein
VVYTAARNQGYVQAIIAKLKVSTGGEAFLLRPDLASLSSIIEAAEEFMRQVAHNF